MSKKSQITLFILLGIVILMILSFLFYIRSQTVTTLSRGNVRQTVDSILASTPIKVYVESCLDKATKDALVLVGMQGGWIYNNQVSDTSAWLGPPSRLYAMNLIPYENQNVSYGIYKRAEDPPNYPYQGSLNPDDSTYAFGNLNLLELCDNQGLNAWDLPGAQYSCIQYDVQGSKNSIQEYLEKYITQKTKECVDIKTLTKELGYDIKEGNITTRVLFGDEDVLVTADYEIIINMQGESITKLEKFSVKPKVRLKKIYELAYYLIDEETKNIFFNITSNESLINLKRCPDKSRKNFDQPCLLPNMSVEQIRDPCLSNHNCNVSNYSDIIRIQDNVSLINGKPFIFQFGVKNRAPALDFIDESVDNTQLYYHYLKNTYGMTPSELYQQGSPNTPPESYNIVVNANNMTIIYPYAIDPDGDDLTYNYTGWKTPIPILVEGNYHGGGSYNEWESSDKYRSTKKDAFVFTNASDIGYHWIRITVSDNEGLYDYQDIKILVI